MNCIYSERDLPVFHYIKHNVNCDMFEKNKTANAHFGTSAVYRL